ncbi:hypothetical protein EAE96_009715 [Botrytis aclada]|nr:hypothetical protein EAE96_009715 [Botrytis aclada]
MLFEFILCESLIATACGTSTPTKSNTSTNSCVQLAAALPGQVCNPGTVNYTAETQSFFSKISWLSPYCVFSPLTSGDLATGVEILARTNTSFAIRSGGHAAVAGIASTDHGVMIATTSFTEKTLVPLPNDFGVPYLRAGAAFRWSEIYEFLEPYGLIAVGGRVAPVGSSLVLGGGLSYHASLHGWAANNVINFELVTANGTILQVNDATYPDLFWALKGGSNNFGVVTRYDLKTYESGLVFGGSVQWGANATQQYLDAYTAYIAPGGGIDDANGNLMPDFSYSPMTGTESSGTVYFYNGNDPSPKAFENFTAIPTVSSEVGIMNFSAIVSQTEFFASLINRWSWYDTSILFSNETSELVYNIVVGNAKLQLSRVNCTVGFALEPMTVAMQHAAITSGGDAISLDPSKGSFLVAEVYVDWSDPNDDQIVKAFLTSTIAEIEEQTKAKGLYYPFKWLNDAGLGENPISSYGYGASLSRLRAISKKYDPNGVFQKLVPGFKLGFDFAGV